jgi:hypothetical protein
MDEGNAAIQSWGGLPVVGDGGNLMTHHAGSVNTQMCDGFCTTHVHLIF